MKIHTIFAVEIESLYSAMFDDKNTDELSHLMNCWNDVEYLRTFFKANISYLTNGFFGNLTINQAVQITLRDAEILEEKLLRIASMGKIDKTNTLQTIFKSLDDNEQSIPLHQKTKLKGSITKSWLRIYAIRIGANLFVITGGGIKLTKTMNESELLKKELQKLEITKNYLFEIGLLDEDDYELLEI